MPRRLAAAEPDKRNAERDDGDAEPAIAADALVKKEFCTESARGVGECAKRHDETDFAEGKNGEKREKAESHHGDASPHPGQAERLKDETNESAGAKVVDFADALHGAADAQFAAGAGHNDEKEEEGLEHG